jgi:hypothetical protein
MLSKVGRLVLSRTSYIRICCGHRTQLPTRLSSVGHVLFNVQLKCLAGILYRMLSRRFAVSTFEAEAYVNVVQKFSPYRKENTTLHHYKDQLVNAV